MTDDDDLEPDVVTQTRISALSDDLPTNKRKPSQNLENALNNSMAFLRKMLPPTKISKITVPSYKKSMNYLCSLLSIPIDKQVQYVFLIIIYGF